MWKAILGLVLVIVAMIWGAVLSWSNPDMTNRRLWLEYPEQLASIVILFFVGWLCFVSYTHRK